MHSPAAGSSKRLGNGYLGATAAMFLTFIGFSSNQFHGYLFELKGLAGLAIGIILMSGAAVSVLGPIVQVYAIRHFGGPHRPLLSTCFIAWISLTALPHAHGFWGLWTFHIFASFAFSSLYPLLTATTFDATRESGHAGFIRIRSIGTGGFLLGCMISLFFPRPTQLPLLYAGFGASFLFAGLAIIPGMRYAVRNPKQFIRKSFARNPKPIPTQLRQKKEKSSAPGLRHALHLLKRPETLFLLVLIAIMGFANTMATSMQGNYLTGRWQLDQRFISIAWIISTGFEIPWMMLCSWVMHRVSLKHAIALGFFGTSIKLCLLAFAGLPAIYAMGLAFHGCFFSFVQIGMGLHLDRHYRPEERPSLQALSSALSQALPAAMAGLTAGVIWHYHSLHAVYLFAAVLSLVVVIIAGFRFWPATPQAPKNSALPGPL